MEQEQPELGAGHAEATLVNNVFQRFCYACMQEEDGAVTVN